MVEIKAMPDREKYELVLQQTSVAGWAGHAYVVEELGPAAGEELAARWADGVVPVLPESTWAEKYETAYANMVWIGRTNFEFVRERMGDDGVAGLIQADAEALGRHTPRLPAAFLAFVRALMPGIAFNMAARQFAYQLQWITPYTVEELGWGQAVFEIPRCKILDYPGSDDLCECGCQGTFPQWTAGQFKIGMAFERRDHACTCTLTRLS